MRIIRKIAFYLTAFVLALSIIPLSQPSTASAAETACDNLYYASNDVLFFNACEETCSEEGSSTAIKGVDNIEKIWNFYTSKGLTPVATAGIMGNFSQESEFDPAIKQNETSKTLPVTGDGVTGYGLAQWTFQARQAGLFKKMQEAGIGKYLESPWGPREKNREIPAEDIDKLLEVQLNYSWDGDTTTISSFADKINSFETVDGDNGSAVFFHAAYEGSSDNAEQIKERVADAKTILANFSNKASPSGEGCGTGTLGGVSNLDDAVAWAKKYVSDTKEEYKDTLDVSGTELSNGENPKFVYNFGHGSGSYCWNAADCGQCVALTGWFVTTQTTDKEFLYENGGAIVDRYEAAGLPTGREPKPFSIFSAKSSAAGHTGVVLGVLENGDVITAEANWDSNGSVGVWRGDIKKRFAGKDLKFAYFDDRLSGDALKANAK